MKRFFLLLVMVILIANGKSVLAQYCTSVGPASTLDSNVEGLGIVGDGVTSISYAGCPGVVGLDDQTLNYSVDLTANNSYQLNVIFGTCGNNFLGNGEVWIDFNGDQTFDPSESLGTWEWGASCSNSKFQFYRSR